MANVAKLAVNRLINIGWPKSGGIGGKTEANEPSWQL